MIETLTIGGYAPAKTAKTTFALSVPKPMVIFDFDQSFGRAEARYRQLNPDVYIFKIPPEEKLDDLTKLVAINPSGNNVIIVRQYRLPIRLPNKPLTGWTELWDNTFIPEILACYQNHLIKSVVIDTGTVFWEVDRMANMEKIQEKALQAGKDRAAGMTFGPQTIEYGRPNIEARSIVGAAKYENTNLIILHHEVDKYVDNQVVGKKWQGFKEMDQIVDIIVSSELSQHCPTHNVNVVKSELGAHQKCKMGDYVPIMTVQDCGYSLKVNGLKIPNPTFGILLNYVNALSEG